MDIVDKIFDSINSAIDNAHKKMDADKLAKKQVLGDHMADFFGSRRGMSDAFIKKIENNEVPFLTIDWKKE